MEVPAEAAEEEAHMSAVGVVDKDLEGMAEGTGNLRVQTDHCDMLKEVGNGKVG